MHPSTATLTTQHSYTFIKALKSPWSSPDRQFLRILGWYQPQGQQQRPHSAVPCRRALATVTSAEFSPALEKQRFLSSRPVCYHCSLPWYFIIPRSWNHSTVDSCCTQMLPRSNSSFRLPLTAKCRWFWCSQCRCIISSHEVSPPNIILKVKGFMMHGDKKQEYNSPLEFWKPYVFW